MKVNLSKREADILDFFFKGLAKLSQVAKALNLKLSNVSRYAKKLVAYGFLVKLENKLFSLNSLVKDAFFKVKKVFQFIKLSDLIVGKILFLLAFSTTKEKFKLSDIDLARATTKRLLARLRAIGFFFMSKKGIYVLREEAKVASYFCRKILVHAYFSLASKELNGIIDFTVSFNSANDLEVVFVTNQENNTSGFYLTSFSIFDQYGVKLISAGKHYYSNVKPKLTDLIVHTLALSKDVRTTTYVCALMIKNKFEASKLLEKKQKFDTKEIVESLIEFMKSKERVSERFPSWQEVEEVAYG